MTGIKEIKLETFIAVIHHVYSSYLWRRDCRYHNCILKS